MLRVLTAARLEPLADWLADRMARAPLPPLERETVVIAQNHGLADWLTRALADRIGCAAGLDVVTPRALVGRLVRRVTPSADGGPAAPFERDALRWRLARLLDGLPDEAVFAPVRAFADRLGPDAPVLLAERLARLFDDYQVFRPDVLGAWERGAPTGEPDVDAHPHAAWQAALWRTLAAERPGRSRAAQTDALVAALDAMASAADLPPGVPSRVTVFGAGLFPPTYLRVLHALGRLVEVHALTVTPTGERPPDAFAHPLLDDLGRRAIEHAAVLASLGATFLPPGEVAPAQPVTEGVPTPPLRSTEEVAPAQPVTEGVPTALARLQSDLAADRPGRHPLDPADRSLTVHACHSPRRELEVLRDQLLDAFETLPGLRPHDVLVVVPDLATYAPLVDAVFGADDDTGGALAAHVVGHPHSPARRVLDAVGLLLAAPSGRATATELLDLLDAPALRRAAGLRADEMPALREAVREAGIRWGRDGAHRAAHGLPMRDRHTWREGLDRLMLGVAMGADAPDLDGLVPVAADADLVGRLAHWADRLFDHAAVWDGPPQAPSAWSDALGAALDDLVAPADDDEQEAVRWLREAVRGLADAAEETPVPFAAVRRTLAAAMEAFAPRRRVLTGRITVADPVALRFAPFRVVAFLGLGAGSWPPVHTPDALDLMAVALRDGDESPQAGGRRLFLDAVLSARDRLILSSVARSERDDSPLAPSPALAALLDTLDATFGTGDGRPASAHFVVPHRLQPFSPAYFDGRDARLFSYRRPVVRADRRAAAFADDDLPPPDPPPPTVDAAALAAAWANPSRDLLTRRLGLADLREGADEDPDDEPLGVDGLDAWAAKTTLLDAPPGVDARRRLLGSGRLPDGPLGDVWAERLALAVAPVAEARAAVAGRPLTVEAHGTSDLDGAPTAWTVRATLAHADDAAGIAVVSRPGRLRAVDWVGAWAAHLAWTLSDADRWRDAAPETRLVGETEAWRFGPVAHPADLLAILVRGWWVIRREPVPLFERTSRAYADARAKEAWSGDASRAVGAARRVFEGDGFRSAGERSDDPHVRRLWEGRDPLATAAFEKWARTLWKPLFDHARPLS